MDYGTRLFVNGTEVFTAGVVADSADKAVPGGSYMTYPVYIGEDGQAELICQYANFVHHEGGHIKSTFMSTPQNIEEYKAGDTLVSLVLSGGMLTLAFYFLLSAVMQRKAVYASLAFCCLLMGLRNQLFFNIHLLPDISWYLQYRLASAVVILMPFSILLLLRMLYPFEKKAVTLVYAAGMAGILLWLAGADTKSIVLICQAGYYFSLPYLLYLLYAVIRHFTGAEKPRRTDWITFAGFALLLVTLVTEALLTRVRSFVTHYGLVPDGMLIFVLVIDTSIGIGIREQEIALAESRSRSEMLRRMNEMNLDFFHKITHELKTPLTVISGYAQLTEMEILSDQLNSDTPENLKTIQKEAMRLSDMVTKLTDYSNGKNSGSVFSAVKVGSLLERVAVVCSPMCLKNNNLLTVSGKESADAFGSGEMLLQVFINLVINANHHTKDGMIAVRASDTESREYVTFRVSDSGSGIAADALPHVFEKGYSGDGSSGLGLTICREAVEVHGGTIEVESTGENGTTFVFTVLRKELIE